MWAPMVCIVASFWSAFGWPLIFAVLMAIELAVCMYHFRTFTGVVESSCCCAAPVLFSQTRAFAVTSSIVGVFACISSAIVAYVDFRDEGKIDATVVFASLSSVACLVGAALFGRIFAAVGALRSQAVYAFSDGAPRGGMPLPTTVEVVTYPVEDSPVVGELCRPNTEENLADAPLSIDPTSSSHADEISNNSAGVGYSYHSHAPQSVNGAVTPRLGYKDRPIQ